MVLKRKIKKYAELVEEQKMINREPCSGSQIDAETLKAVSEAEVREHSVTRKMGRTDVGDISNAIDPLEMGSNIAKSLEENYN